MPAMHFAGTLCLFLACTAICSSLDVENEYDEEFSNADGWAEHSTRATMLEDKDVTTVTKPMLEDEDGTTSSAADPTCATGIRAGSSTKGVCCAKSCGSCGGPGCGRRPGGGAKCCWSAVMNKNISCNVSPPPCVGGRAPTSEPTHYPTEVPTTKSPSPSPSHTPTEHPTYSLKCKDHFACQFQTAWFKRPCVVKVCKTEDGKEGVTWPSFFNGKQKDTCVEYQKAESMYKATSVEQVRNDLQYIMNVQCPRTCLKCAPNEEPKPCGTWTLSRRACGRGRKSAADESTTQTLASDGTIETQFLDTTAFGDRYTRRAMLATAWTQNKLKHCYQSSHPLTHTTEAAAKKKCDEMGDECAGVYDNGCKGVKQTAFRTCKKGYAFKTSSVSCIYTKGEHHAGTQPPPPPPPHSHRPHTHHPHTHTPHVHTPPPPPAAPVANPPASTPTGAQIVDSSGSGDWKEYGSLTCSATLRNIKIKACVKKGTTSTGDRACEANDIESKKDHAKHLCTSNKYRSSTPGNGGCQGVSYNTRNRPIVYQLCTRWERTYQGVLNDAPFRTASSHDMVISRTKPSGTYGDIMTCVGGNCGRNYGSGTHAPTDAPVQGIQPIQPIPKKCPAWFSADKCGKEYKGQWYAAKTCSDRTSNCDKHKQDGLCSAHGSYSMKSRCEFTCRVCTPKKCEDTFKIAYGRKPTHGITKPCGYSMVASSCCGLFFKEGGCAKPEAAKLCPVTCGLC